MTQFKEIVLFAEHIEEPRLEFGLRQKTDHPKDGLYLYGPRVPVPGSSPLRVGVIGTKNGLGYFRKWAAELMAPIPVPPPGPRDKTDRLHLSPFPGLREAFGLILDTKSLKEAEIDSKELDDATLVVNHHEAVAKAVDVYVDRIKRHVQREESAIDVWIFVLPEPIFDRCRRNSRRQGLPLVKGNFVKRQSKKFVAPLFEGIIDNSEEDIFEDIPDFHRQVKAKLLGLNFTSQLIRETTLVPEQFRNKAGYPIRRMQDRATIAWNFATSLYYKTQPQPPWKIADMRPSVP